MSASRFPSGLSASNKGSQIFTEVVRKSRIIPIDFADGTSETDTSFTLPTYAIVRNVLVRVKTAEATGTTKTIDVGTNTSGVSDDPDGFLDGISVASTGLVGPTLVSTGQTRGALLRDDEDGAGALVPNVDVSSGGAVVSWTPGSADFAELEADIIIEYDEVVDLNA